MYKRQSILPTEPTVRFLNYLLEDFADEWLTKAMFHYRWYYDADIKKAGEILPRWGNLTATENELEPMSEFVRERQISRLYVVGSNDTTAPVIEDSYRRILTLMSDQMNVSPFMFGARPSSSDFGLYGQLTQLAVFDPTPMKIADDIASRVVAWVGVVEDLSGLECREEHWTVLSDSSDSLKALFGEVGKVYVPALLANAKAVENGDAKVLTEIDGKEWEQEPFPYQAKCLQWIRQEFVRLEEREREEVLAFLDGTDCHRLFEK